MRIFDFDIKKGIYSFEFGELITESHSHPVIEIINAANGTFALQSNGQTNKNLVFAIINPNIEHRVISKSAKLRVLMLESNNSQVSNFLNRWEIRFQNGFFCETSLPEKDELFSQIKTFSETTDLKTPADSRIVESIKFIEENELEYKSLIPELTSRTFLSDSRLSHLFKEHIGISIKKYLVWNKLRQAINLYLTENTNLTEVSLESGFFDQAHLTHSFKNILGVSPSTAYNSRIVQS